MNNYRIDNLQYSNWSKEIFQINNEAKLDAVHVSIAYHEDFNEVKKNVEAWNKYFLDYKNLIFHGKTFKDIEKAHQEKKTAIFFGFQNCSPIEDDISLVEKVHNLGARFMQLTYNNQSLLATGCYEKNDSGVTRMGKEVIKEMNKIGLVVDMSHSAEKSTFDAIELSTKPIAITHANPSFWFAAKRNKSNELLKALASSKGMLGLSLYPHHLKDTSKSLFKGMVRINEQAAHSNSFLSGRSILLSKGAKSDSIPGLEIFTNDVKATHSASVAQVDDEQIFYLGTRCLNRSEAERIIVEGFLEPLSRIMSYQVRAWLANIIESKWMNTELTINMDDQLKSIVEVEETRYNENEEVEQHYKYR